jgi:serine phosphatase RsbU (regulator of sigma subunit)
MSIVTESVKSVMGAPIVVREQTYGVIYLDNSEVSSLFKEKDLDVLGMISNQAGISIENALLYRSLKDKERLKREMEIAERIQTAILPKELGDEEFEIAAVMKTATEVGGDFYDVQRGPDGKLWFAIGDVMGHGVTPGLIMMMAQSVFSAEVRRGGGEESLEEVMRMMNRILYENIQNRMEENYYMTLQFARHEGGGRVRCIGGGHPYMVWYRKGRGECETVETEGTLIGIKAELGKEDIKEKEIEMGIGDMLVLYTDGVSEARREGGDEMYGIDRLGACVKRNSGRPLEEIKGEILKDVETFSGGYQSDDVTMVLVRRGK